MGLVERTENSGAFQKWFFPHSSCQVSERIFLQYFLSTWSSLCRWNSQNCGDLPWLGPPGIFNSWICSWSLQQLINYSSSFPTPAIVPAALSTCESLFWLSYGCLHLPASISSPGNSVLYCVHTSLLDLKLLCSALHLLLGWNVDLQVPYAWRWRSEVSVIIFNFPNNKYSMSTGTFLSY